MKISTFVLVPGTLDGGRCGESLSNVNLRVAKALLNEGLMAWSNFGKSGASKLQAALAVCP
jgi:hypothetical protein